jgi:hypothetical protein
MGQFKPHMEIFPPSQRRLWRELKPSVRLGLVLYGDKPELTEDGVLNVASFDSRARA